MPPFFCASAMSCSARCLPDLSAAKNFITRAARPPAMPSQYRPHAEPFRTVFIRPTYHWLRASYEALGQRASNFGKISRSSGPLLLSTDFILYQTQRSFPFGPPLFNSFHCKAMECSLVILLYLFFPFHATPLKTTPKILNFD